MTRPVDHEPQTAQYEADATPDPAEQWLWRPDALRLSAIHYARSGIAVFPLKPADKVPATRNGFKDATTDAAQVERWWTDMPQANIGAPTGHRFDVIDVDGFEGIVSMLEKYPSLNNIGIPLLGRATTPRGGGHHLFVPPMPGRRNGAKLLPGVDCRALGGYVVLPPSRGANGRLYRWLHALSIGKTQAAQPEGAA